jgi:hypothetical protein
MFFFVKKNQKTFVPLSRARRLAADRVQKFFASFLQKRRLLLFVSVLAPLAALASGEIFQDALFTDRTAFLLDVPASGLADGKPALVQDKLTARQATLPHRADNVEARDIAPALVPKLAAMRAAPDGDAAWDAGAGLPDAARLYTAGAVDFIRGKPDKAALRFKQILALQDHAAAPRAAWAAYMLGRIALQQNDLAGTETYFPQTRRLILAGARDDLDVGVSSFGEQARLRLRHGDVAGAVSLYMQQAAHGWYDPVSLDCAAEHALNVTGLLPAALKDSTTRALLLRYAVQSLWDSPELGRQRLLDAVLASPNPSDPADALAALAYANGDYAHAEGFAERAPAPFSQWLRAKIALKSGDDEKAAMLFDAAMRTKGAAAISARLGAEAAAMQVRHGDFVLALKTLWPIALAGREGDYWADALYLAERILTLPELERFVAEAAPVATDSTEVQELRDLFARRLARAGRIKDAIPYYKDPATRAVATNYLAQAEAPIGLSGVDKGAALWRAATTLRWKGLELTGTEFWQDGAAEDGNYAFPLGVYSEPFVHKPGEFKPEELRRYTESAPIPDKQFHYRYVAVEFARQAVQAVPPRSQAAAAMLCQAADWMRVSHEDKEVHTLWVAYLRTGAAVPFAKHFGKSCPDPDFDAARTTNRRLAIIRAHDFIHTHKLLLGAGGGLALAGLAFAATTRIRRKASQ